LLDRRYLRGAQEMREFIARLLERQGRGGDAEFIRWLDPTNARTALGKDPNWTRRMREEDAAHERAGWRERSAKHQAKKKSRGVVK
jgi:hypothetical protein